MILSKLRKLARSWGGDIIQVSLPYMRKLNLSIAPSTVEPLGHDPNHKIIYYTPQLPHWGDVLHEMGHIFATSDSPDMAHDDDWLGWEYVVARGITTDLEDWFTNNAEYGIAYKGKDMYFGDLTREQQYLYLEDRINIGMQLGIISRQGRPVPIHAISPRQNARRKRFLQLHNR